MGVVRWVVQTNLGDGDNAKTIQESCAKLGIECVGVKPIPFSTDLPTVPESDKTDIFYGSTNFIKNAYGVHPNFNMLKYIENYGEYCINYDACFDTIGGASEIFKNQDPEGEIFVRPVEDIKEFAGLHTNIARFIEWTDKMDDDMEVNYSTPIVFASPKEIAHEWRLFFVGGKFSTGSYYRNNGKGVFIEYLPTKVIEFAEMLCDIWTPDDMFVMDIGEVNGVLGIIECNGWNSCGFYKSDIHKLVKDVSTFVESNE